MLKFCVKFFEIPIYIINVLVQLGCGWSGGAMVLGKLPVPGRPTIWITVGEGPIALTVGAGVVWTFLLSSILSPLSPSLWETARYRLKYCLKGQINPKQSHNQSSVRLIFGMRTDNGTKFYSVPPQPMRVTYRSSSPTLIFVSRSEQGQGHRL